jgi:hypothetical protein
VRCTEVARTARVMRAPPQAGHQSALVSNASTAWQWLQRRSMFQRYSTADAVGREPDRSEYLGLRSVLPPGAQTPKHTWDKLRRLGPKIPRRAFSEGQLYRACGPYLLN